MNQPEDIEIYVRVNDTERVLAFLNEAIGKLTFDCEIDEGHDLYVYGNSKILLNKRIHDNYISVYLKGVTHWPSDIEFAREISKKLNVVVRCDPGSAYPDVPSYAPVFVEIRSGNEALIDWG